MFPQSCTSSDIKTNFFNFLKFYNIGYQYKTGFLATQESGGNSLEPDLKT